jgi:hypothetical protein
MQLLVGHETRLAVSHLWVHSVNGIIHEPLESTEFCNNKKSVLVNFYSADREPEFLNIIPIKLGIGRDRPHTNEADLIKRCP